MPEALLAQPALSQAALVRSGQIKATELVEASLRAIDAYNPTVNAFVTLGAEQALEQARQVRSGDPRPFCGVPIAVKDLGALSAGLRTSMGSRATGDYVPAIDSACVARLKASGAIVIGKTNTPELGILPVTEPKRFGPTRNPWDTTRTPGGSSGGSAAAVASGMVALAHASDGGGSIRIPAACCGLVGLKPSRGRVSSAPGAEMGTGFATDGALSRTVADVAQALEVLAGYETGDPYWAPANGQPFPDAVEQAPDQLRVAVATKPANDAPIDPDCEAGARKAASMLESLGHRVTEASPPIDIDSFTADFITVWMSIAGAGVKGVSRLIGREIEPDQLEDLTRQMFEISGSISAPDFISALEALRAQSRRLVGFFSGYDLLVTPTLAQPPLALGGLDPQPGEEPVQMLWNSSLFVPFPLLWNVTGQPAISVPLYATDAGLPIGAQLVAPPAQERLLLSLAAQLERLSDWPERWPQL